MTYPAGILANATVHGVPNIRVFRCGRKEVPSSWRWRTQSGTWVADEVVTDVRPLVTLTHEDVEDVLVYLRSCALSRNAQRIRDYLVEQTRPVITEPMGLAAAVLTAEGRTFIRTAKPNWPWVDAEDPRGNAWQWGEGQIDHCTPIKVLSPGVTP